MSNRRPLAAVAVAVVAATALTACGTTDLTAPDRTRASSAAPATATTATTVAPPTTTTAPPPTTTTEAPPPAPSPPEPSEPAPLTVGSRGPEVLALQERLAGLGYWLGRPDGSFQALTAQAVLAFQKASGLARDGVAGPATLTALDTATRPAARSTAGTVVEIDLTRQLLLVVRDGAVVTALNTSTGAPATPTPPGRFTVTRRIDGVRRAPLGDLYRPAYFNGGIAVHGSPSIPGWPASHGCARVSDPAMDHLWATGAVAVGTPVQVYA